MTVVVGAITIVVVGTIIIVVGIVVVLVHEDVDIALYLHIYVCVYNIYI